MDKEIKNSMKNYLVVGASSGIGNELVQILEEKGAKVTGTYNSHQIDSKSPGLEFHFLNVLDRESNLDFIDKPLDGLVYCPGSINLRPFARLTSEDFDSDFDLQVGGAIRIIQKALPQLKAAEQASIVLFSTVAVQTGFKFHTQVSVSKGAIEGLTRALASELAPKIRVNCIAPSLTNTPLATNLLNSDQKVEANSARHPLERIGKPEEIAEMAAFLLSDKAGWITGQVFKVDGGISALRN